ncbi:hypothetical protein VNO77_24476 [Canavalia gladiata]|uniref:Uncharacterized protein n=1 Tax=Canavalia gladiata TaxID=3824 RepID=A0AAN9L730_CANGL
METGGDNRSIVNLGSGVGTNKDENQTSPLTEQECKNNDNSNPNPAGSQSETHHSSTEDMLDLHSSLTPSTNESSPGNLSHEPTNTDNKTPTGALESCQKQSTENESPKPLQVTEQGHEGIVNSSMGTPISPSSESSTQEDIHVSPNATHKSHIAAESSDGSNRETNTNHGSETKNPPVQVMERPGESGTSNSPYSFPSHVFARTNTNSPGDWSAASNESLFSIYMGNMSFSNELVCFKSGELDKPGDVCMLDHPNASPNHQPNESPNHQPPSPLNNFNTISQRAAELHEESLKLTEAKAAETMREVAMENTLTTENVVKAESKRSDSHRLSNGSTNSYAFQSSEDRHKNISSKSVGEKQIQEESEEKETPNADDQATQNSNTNAPPNKWLGCFPCCG